MLNWPNKNLDWNEQRSRNKQPHDEEAEEVQRKKYFSPACFYCVKTICAPCGVVIAWTKFAKAESETNILDFLTATYPNKAICPDYVCIDKACKVLRSSIAQERWESWSKTTCIIVDAYYYINHHVKNLLC